MPPYGAQIPVEDRWAIVAYVKALQVSRGAAGSLRFEAPLGRFGVSGDGSYRDAHDIRTPSGRLGNTAIRTLSGGLGVGRSGRQGGAGVGASAYRSAYGIPGGFVGAHPHGVRVEIQRLHGEGQADYHPRGAMRLTLEGAATRYFHQEFEAGGDLGVEFGAITYTAGARLHTAPRGFLRGGAAGLSAEARRFEAGGLYFTPSTRELSAAAYAFQKAQAGPLALEAGLRLDGRRVSPEVAARGSGLGAIGVRRFSGLSGAFGVQAPLGRGLHAQASALRSLRTPGIEELFSEGPHLAAYSFEIGNPDLRPEVGLGLEAGVRWASGPAAVRLTAFRNTFRRFIFPRATGAVNYRTLLPEYQVSGLDARMWGAEAEAAAAVGGAAVEASAAYVRGRLAPGGEPLPWTPPLQGRLVVRAGSGPVQGGLRLKAAAPQRRVYRFEEPTAGYAVFSPFVQARRSGGRALHTLDVALDNALGAAYHDHLSRVKSIMPEPGRSLRVLYKVYL